MQAHEHTTNLETFIRAMPKVELHVHLDRFSRLQRYGIRHINLPSRQSDQLVSEGNLFGGRQRVTYLQRHEPRFPILVHRCYGYMAMDGLVPVAILLDDGFE